MKLRYYMRGLGIGMLVAALVLVLSGNTGGRMSDEAIKSRAAELGMIEKDKTVLGEVGNKETSEDNAKTGSKEESPPALPDKEAQEKEEVKEPAADKEKEAPDTQPEGAEASEQPESAPLSEQEALANEIEEKAKEIEERAQEVAENAAAKEAVTFVVQRGDSSISVARRAESAGLVSSAADFDVFLCQNGYDKRISIGSYEIAQGATQKEIADVITKSK